MAPRVVNLPAKVTRRKVDIATALTGALTILAALPYEVELLAVVPTWKPWLATVGVFATVGLRLVKLFMPFEDVPGGGQPTETNQP